MARSWYSFVVLGLLVCTNVARGELRLWCEFGGKRFPVGGVEGRDIFCRDGEKTLPVPRDAQWVVEGDLMSNADSAVWCPTYTVAYRDLPERQRGVEPKPYRAEVTVAHVSNGSNISQSEVLHYWPKGAKQPAIMILAWVLDRKIVYAAGQSIPSTKQPNFVAAHRFDLTEAEAAGQAILLLWDGERFVAPAPRFATAAAQRAFYAVLLNDVTGLQAALREGVKPTEATRSRITLLHYAAAAGANECVTELLRTGARPATGGEYGTALNWAVEKGRPRAVELLLAAKSSTETWLRGSLPLHYAIAARQERIALQLVRAGADLDALSWRQLSAVGEAIDAGMVSVVLAALEKGARVDYSNDQYARVLIAQAGLGHTGIVKFLLDHGVPADVESHDLTPLMAGARSGDPAIAQALLAKGANPNHRAANGLTPLMVAAPANCAEYVEALIESGARVNDTTPSGTTALHICAGTDAADVARVLIKHGAKSSLVAKDSGTPLEMALSLQAREVAQLLAAADAKLPIQSPSFATDITRALELDLSLVVSAAIADGWSPNAKLEGGWPALRVAQLCGAKECAHVLQAAGGTVDSTMPMFAVATEIDSAPQRTRIVAPVDPRDLEDEYPRTRMAVEALIDTDGSVHFAHLATPAKPLLAVATLAAIEQWRFEPAMSHGHPVAIKVTLPIAFPSSDERVRSITDVDELPKVEKWIAPVYPPQLRNGGYGGAVVVQCIITEDGRVDRPKVLSSSHPNLSDAVMKVVGKWVYQPAQRDGKPVAVRVAIPIAFTLDE